MAVNKVIKNRTEVAVASDYFYMLKSNMVRATALLIYRPYEKQ
jgi:hypothetical protein